MRTFILTLCILSVAATAGRSWAQLSLELMDLSLEELMDIEVYSVGKKEQRLADAAAAITVISREDIRRSGFTSVPEVLRLVPGVQVARLDANKWAITVRGFNNRLANKLLVLVDGRSVYTPLFAGVFWREQNLPLEDIERIEVIRGPGATLWGANAVNGVINIITRSAADTQGAHVRLGGGTEERANASVRYGGQIDAHTHYRVYGKIFERDTFVDASGITANDDWQVASGGFRVDRQTDEGTSLSLQGSLYDGEAGQTYSVITSPVPPFQEVFTSVSPFRGGHLLGRWQRLFSSQSDMALQVYYDGHDLDDRIASDTRHTLDVDFQHRRALGMRQELVWGVGYRLSRGESVGSFTLSFDPIRRTENLFNAFVQSDVKVANGRGHLTLGTKVEHQHYVGFEVQPNVRFLWQLDERQRLWGAVARALRTPSGAETRTRGAQLMVPTGDLVPDFTQGLVASFPNPDFKSEELTAFEGGYRLQWNESTTVDLAGFYNVYDRLRTFEGFLAPYIETEPAPYLVIPVRAENKMNGKVYGFELEANQRLSSRWHLRGTYSLLRMELDLDAGSMDLFSTQADKEVPEYQATLQSSMDLSPNLQLDLLGRYVDGLPGPRVDSYTTVDARLAWHPLPGWEIAVVGQNLLEERHGEFKPIFVSSLPTQVQRSVYGTLTWRY